MRTALFALLSVFLCVSAHAQVLSTPTYQGSFGTPLALEQGPWVLGEVLFFSGGKLASDYAWRDRVKGRRGSLYSRSDIESDAQNLMSLGVFDRVLPKIYEIPGSPVPSEFASIAFSTHQVRLVFEVAETPKAILAPPPKKGDLPPAAVSGVVFTPTAYRGAGRYSTPGLGLDVNAAYIIGRLYGKNSFANTNRKTNYIDRVGVWMLIADGKMQVQSEGDIRPAVSFGGQGAFLFRDSGQPNVNDPNPTVTVNASQKSTKMMSDAYGVVSKKIGPVRTSVGLMQGNMGDMVAQFSEFLTPDALGFFAGKRGTFVRSRTMPFASVLMFPKANQPLGVEIIKFNGAALNPVLINFKIGYFLKMNFDVGLLKFDGGYDLLGMLQFRYNHFPRR